MHSCRLFALLTVVFVSPIGLRASEPAPLAFRDTFSKSVSSEPFTGRVYVMLSKQDIKEPRSGPNWYNPEAFFALDVGNWKPGETRVIDGKALACPAPLTNLQKSTYTIHAVMDFDAARAPSAPPAA